MRLLSSVPWLAATALLACPCGSEPRRGACSPRPGTVVIDFEHYPGPDGQLGTADDVVPPSTCPGGGPGGCPVAGLSNQWSTLGVFFTRGTLFAAPQGFPGAGFGNHYLSSLPVEGSFSAPVYGIEITSYSKWNAKLVGYDGNGRVLGVANLWHPAPGTSGPWHRGTLRLCSSEPVARFAIIEESGNASLILNLDVLVLATSPH